LAFSKLCSGSSSVLDAANKTYLPILSKISTQYAKKASPINTITINVDSPDTTLSLDVNASYTISMNGTEIQIHSSTSFGALVHK
jgi:hypothetical protein